MYFQFDKLSWNNFMKVRWTYFFKEIVYPTIKFLSSFTLPQVAPNLYKYPMVCWTQKNDILNDDELMIFWRMSVTKQLMDPIDFHCIFFPVNVNGVHAVWLPYFLWSAEEINPYWFGATWVEGELTMTIFSSVLNQTWSIDQYINADK